MQTKVCLDCKQDLPVSYFGSNGNSASGKFRHKPRCRKCNHIYEESVFYGKLYRILGGPESFKCACCGYDRCINALEFHHINPAEKERAISLMRNYSESMLRKEIEKCIILCAICHREYHAGIRELPI